MPYHDLNQPFLLDRGGLRAALIERFGASMTPALLGTSRSERLKTALDVARESGSLARPDAVEVYAFPMVGCDGLTVLVADSNEAAPAVAVPWRNVPGISAEAPARLLEEACDAIELLLRRAEPLVAEVRLGQDEHARRAAGLDDIPWAVARCLRDRGHDLAEASARIAEHADSLWASVLGPAVDAVEDRLFANAAH